MIVDERFAVRTAKEVVSAAKPPAPGEVEALVAEMKENALTAQDLVVDAFLLDPAHADDVRGRLGAGAVLVLDQVGWIKANAESLNGMVDVSRRRSPPVRRRAGRPEPRSPGSSPCSRRGCSASTIRSPRTPVA